VADLERGWGEVMILMKNGKPRFKIYNKTGVLIETIDLLWTQQPDCLWLNYKKIFLSEDVIDYSDTSWTYGMPYEERITIGYNLFFTFSYKTFHGEDNTYNIGKLIDYAGPDNQNKIVCYPRLDDTTFSFEVTDLNDDFSLSLINKYSGAKGYRGLVLNYRSKYPVKTLSWVKSTELAAGYTGDTEEVTTGQINL
jgi:hypothetical protein